MAGADTSGDIRRVDDDRHHYFQLIGLEATESRIRMLDKRVNAIRGPTGRGASRAGAMTDRSERNNRGVTSGFANSGDSDALARGSTSVTGVVGNAREVSAAAAARSASRRKFAAPTTASAHEQMKDEMESARREQQERIKKFRNEFLEHEWRQQWEVSLLQRPTSAEQDDPTLRHFSTCRRPHQKVVVGKDLKEIESMPSHKLCINDGLKRSLSKMRDNLFQRRLNLAIYEKTINEWSLPQLCAEARRKRRGEVVQEGNISATSDKIAMTPGTASAAPVATTAAAPGVHLDSELHIPAKECLSGDAET